MRLVVLIAVLFTTFAAIAAPFASTCPQAGRVSLHVSGTPIRIVLRDLAQQSQVAIAIDPVVKGHVTADFDCVELRDALKWVLPQVHAEFCPAGSLLRVSHQGTGACKHPEPVVDYVIGRGR